MCIQFDVLHLLKKHMLNNYGVVCISKIQFLMHQCSLKLEKSILAKKFAYKTKQYWKATSHPKHAFKDINTTNTFKYIGSIIVSPAA